MLNFKHSHKVKGLLAMVAMAALASPAVAQQANYSCKVLTLVSPYPPGGTTDILARLIAPGLSSRLGATVVVDNRAGASSNIGTAFVARAKPDGCTALLGNNTGIVINRNLYQLRPDPVEALAGVGMVASVPLLLYANKANGFSDFSDFVAKAKAKPQTYAYASGGSGSPQHLLGELLKLTFDLDVLHVPYRGQAPAMTDVLAGQVAFAFETTTALAPHIAGGNITLLATTADERLPTHPDVPTMKELGATEFVFENWYGLFVPKATPDEVLQSLNAALNETLKQEEIAQKLRDLGSRDVHTTTAEIDAFVRKEAPFWAELVKRSGAKVD